MSARDLLRDCRERGVLIRNDGGALLVKPIRGDLPTDIRARLVAQKPAVLKALEAPAPKCPGCGVCLSMPVLCYSCHQAPAAEQAA
jgi:hypothetical protein